MLLENFDVYARALQAGREHVVRIAEGSVLMAHEDGIDQLGPRNIASVARGEMARPLSQRGSCAGRSAVPKIARTSILFC